MAPNQSKKAQPTGAGTKLSLRPFFRRYMDFLQNLVRKWLLGLSVILCTLGSSCTVVPQMVSDDLQLQEQEGLVLLSVNCPSAVGSFSIYPIGSKPNGLLDNFGSPAKVQYCRSQPGTRTFTLPAGQYYIAVFHSASDSLVLDEGQAHHFLVQENVINYIGHIQVSTQWINEHAQAVSVHVSDQEVTDIPDARRKIPALFDQLGFSKLLAHRID